MKSKHVVDLENIVVGTDAWFLTPHPRFGFFPSHSSFIGISKSCKYDYYFSGASGHTQYARLDHKDNSLYVDSLSNIPFVSMKSAMEFLSLFFEETAKSVGNYVGPKSQIHVVFAATIITKMK